MKLVSAFAVVLVIGALGGILGSGATSTSPGRSRLPGAGQPTTTSGASTTARALAPGSHPFESQNESAPQVKPVKPTAVQRPAIRAAVSTFLHGYLPFSYGQGPAGRIGAVTDQEHRDLEASPPQVPPQIRRRHARALGARLAPYAAGEWRATVTVTDGTLIYQLPLVVGDVAGSWEVMAIQN